MKKLFGLLAMVFLVSIGTANALPWTWDLSGTNYRAFGLSVDGLSGTTVNFINDVGAASVSGTTSIISQSLTGGNDDNILDNGDTFTEFGALNVLDADNLSLAFLTNDPGQMIPAFSYIEFSGLSGSIYNYNNGGDGDTTIGNYATNVANDSFDLTFDAGVGTIKMYLDTDYDSTNGALEIADFTLLVGQGTSPEFIVNAAEGQFGIVAGFNSVESGIWSFADGTSFEDWMSLYGTPSIFMSSFNLGATVADIGDDGANILFSVINEGSFQVSAVPEPSTIILLGTGLMGLGFLSRRRKK